MQRLGAYDEEDLGIRIFSKGFAEQKSSGAILNLEVESPDIYYHDLAEIIYAEFDSLVHNPVFS